MPVAFTLIALFLSGQSTSASTGNGSLTKQDPCAGTGAMPTLYHDYLNDVCPPKNEVNSHGICDNIEAENFCVAYCQQSTRFVYGQEFPLGAWCEGPCEISNLAKEMTWSFDDIDMWSTFEKAMNAGISGGWQSTITANVGPEGLSISSPLDEGQCGYWSWVPIKRTVCGRLNWRQYDQGRCLGDTVGRDNWCVEDLRRAPGGMLDGTTIFVYTDCENRLPLPMSQQRSTIYKMPGVALSHVEHVALELENHSNQQIL